MPQRCSCWVQEWGWKEGHNRAVPPSAAERGPGASSPPPELGALPSSPQRHTGEGRETLGSSNAQGPAQPLCHLGSASPDSGGRAEDIPPSLIPQHHRGSFGSSVSRTWLETSCPWCWQGLWSFFPCDKYGNRVCTRSELGINSIAQIGDSRVSFTCPCSSSVSTLFVKGDLLQVTSRKPNSLFISPPSWQKPLGRGSDGGHWMCLLQPGWGCCSGCSFGHHPEQGQAQHAWELQDLCHGPKGGGRVLILAAFTACRGHPLAAGTALPGHAKLPAWHLHTAIGQPRGTCPAPKRLILAQVGKPPSCCWMLKIWPTTCQKLAARGCANRCTKRQNYALQTVINK